MHNDQNFFFYPEDMKQKAIFFGWTGINLTILVASFLLSFVAFVFTWIWLPMLGVVLFGILTLQVENISIARQIKLFINYLILDQLEFYWRQS